jgi:hypothetical protein
MTMIIDGTNGITFPDTSRQYNSYYNFKNRIINGAMVINQRGGTVTATPSGAYGVDRFKSFASGGGVFTSVQSSVVPTGQGFKNSVLLTVTTADSSIAAADYYAFNQEIEGFNVADLGFGAASAQTVTLSFWVRSSVTGTYSVALYNSAGTRGYPATFAISAADTWTFVSLTVPGDTGGTWLTDNSVGLIVRYDLGSGSNANGTANTWNTSGTFAASRTSSTANWIATSGATFYITGVQLEKGIVSTPFDFRPYGTELALCQRYYYRNAPGAAAKYLVTTAWANQTTTAFGIFQFPVTMRTSPSALEQTGTAGDYAVLLANTATTCSAVPTFGSASETNSLITFTVASGLTVGQAGTARTTGTAGYLGWSAEL